MPFPPDIESFAREFSLEDFPMLAHLTSGPECVLAYLPHSLYVVVDRVDNPRRSASLHLVAWNRAEGPAERFFVDATAKAKAIATKAGKDCVDFTLPDGVSFSPPGYDVAYETYDMTLAIPDNIPPVKLPPGYQFRDYSESYLQEYYDTVRLVFKDNPDTSVPTFEMFAERCKAFKVLPQLLVYGDRIAGFARVAENLEEITAVGVRPEHRGKKLSEQLVLQALRLLQNKGRRRTSLTVLSTNAPALAVYRRMGFRTTKQRVCFSSKSE